MKFHLKCSKCGREYDDESAPWQDVEKYGHITICPYCGHQDFARLPSVEPPDPRTVSPEALRAARARADEKVRHLLQSWEEDRGAERSRGTQGSGCAASIVMMILFFATTSALITWLVSAVAHPP